MHARMIRSVLTVLVLAAILTDGCGASGTRVSSSSRAFSTPTATARAAFRWRQVTTPPGVAWQQITTGLVIAPADGHVAWICTPIGTDRFAIWATSDAGTSWRHVSTLAPTTPTNPNTCVLFADVNDVRALTANFWWGCGECGTLAHLDYYSIDGGAQWYPLASVVQKVARGMSQTYAIVTDASPASGSNASPQLVASTDVLHTWHTITPGDAAARNGVAVFAVAPHTEELLAVTQDDTLWRSTDGGDTWSRLALTWVAQSAQDYELHWLGAPGGWMICDNARDATNTFRCSTDLGQTWRAIHVPTYTVMCPTCGKGFPVTGQVTACNVSGPTQDGSFLAACPTFVPTGMEPYQGSYIVYSLALDASQWKPIGSAPNLWLELAGQGVLWCPDVRHDALYVALEP